MAARRRRPAPALRDAILLRANAGTREAGLRTARTARCSWMAGRLALDATPLERAIGRFDPPTVPLDADGQGIPYATYGFAAQLAALAVDTELGTVHPAHRRGA